MAESNFQDVVVLSSDSLQVRGQAISVGTDAGAKSVILANDVGALHLHANPTAVRSQLHPDANGTVGLITAISAGTTLASNGLVVLSNSNGFTFGLNGNTVTASYTQSTGPAAISAGTTLASSGTVVFSNSNNVTFGLNGNTITATASFAGQAAVFGLGVSTGGNTAGNTGTTNGTIVFAGVGGISLSQSTAGGSLATISISMTQSTAPGAIAAGTQTATSGTIVYSNSNGISFGMSNSSVVTASADYVRSISAGGADATGNRIIFSNSNNISFGANGATITASFNDAGNDVQAIIAGTQTAGSGTVSFANSNGFTFGMSNSSVITMTYERRVTVLSNWAEFGTNFPAINASLSYQRMSVPMHISATEAAVVMALSGNSGSSGGLSLSLAVYTLAGSTASLASSGTRAMSWTSGSLTTASSQYGGASGTRYRTVGINFSLTPGDYLFAVNISTTNDGTWRMMGRQGVNLVGVYDGYETAIFMDGVSVSSSGAFPASIVATNTNYNRTGLNALKQPGFVLLGTN